MKKLLLLSLFLIMSNTFYGQADSTKLGTTTEKSTAKTSQDKAKKDAKKAEDKAAKDAKAKADKTATDAKKVEDKATKDAKANSNKTTGKTPAPTKDKVIGKYNGKTLYEGPQGGKYYINSNGNKTYIK